MSVFMSKIIISHISDLKKSMHATGFSIPQNGPVLSFYKKNNK